LDEKCFFVFWLEDCVLCMRLLSVSLSFSLCMTLSFFSMLDRARIFKTCINMILLCCWSTLLSRMPLPDLQNAVSPFPQFYHPRSNISALTSDLFTDRTVLIRL